jgi:DNA mismatch endonuclease (patch repair protein)
MKEFVGSRSGIKRNQGRTHFGRVRVAQLTRPRLDGCEASPRYAVAQRVVASRWWQARADGTRTYRGPCMAANIKAVDNLTPEQRSRQMARVRNANTKPEFAVRRALHGLGYRYRLHDRRLPGKPDLVFPSRRKVIFVHGCFWHRHPGCKNTRLPKTRLDFWVPKLEENAKRDVRLQQQLREDGWDVLVVWECEVARLREHMPRIVDFLEGRG